MHGSRGGWRPPYKIQISLNYFKKYQKFCLGPHWKTQVTVGPASPRKYFLDPPCIYSLKYNLSRSPESLRLPIAIGPPPSSCVVRRSLTSLHFYHLENHKANCYYFSEKHLYDKRNFNWEIDDPIILGASWAGPKKRPHFQKTFFSSSSHVGKKLNAG